ncbi:MAG TPA: hypothetical protein VN231_02830 [Allosphingosinicella sp.]|nr:hypothetical protein [Allosphingosinicella sp.]
MFSEPKARGAWRQFRFRVELMLSSVSGGVRRELLEDLATHVRELVALGPDGASEYERLRGALERMGDPREFLAPLVGEAIFRDPPRDVGFGQAGRVLLSLLSRGWRLAWRSASALLAALLGALAGLVAFGSLLDPRAVGLFRLGPDDIHLRLLGGQGGVPLFAPWFAIGLLALAAASMAFAWRQSRRLILEILTNGAPGHGRH